MLRASILLTASLWSVLLTVAVALGYLPADSLGIAFFGPFAGALVLMLTITALRRHRS